MYTPMVFVHNKQSYKNSKIFSKTPCKVLIYMILYQCKQNKFATQKNIIESWLDYENYKLDIY